MKNLIYIGNKLACRGGAPTSVDILAPLLSKEGYKVLSASAKKNQLLRLLDMLWLVYRNRRSVDYVLIDTYSTRNFWYAIAVAGLCQFFHIKYLPVLHGGELPSRLKNSPALSRLLFKRAYTNLAPSLFLKTVFQQAGILNVRYIPNSIRLQDYHFKERKDLRPRLMWVRAFAEIYNPIQAVKVLELLLLKFPDAELCMVGPVKDDSWKECLAYARKHRLPVRFAGRLTKEEWTSLAANYDIFLNTTKIDNSPVSLIEAMALGLPVVSTNVGGIPYLISADIEGVLVPAGDAERMAQAVAKLLREPGRSLERTLAARKKVEAFDWNLVKKQWHSLLSAETV